MTGNRGGSPDGAARTPGKGSAASSARVAGEFDFFSLLTRLMTSDGAALAESPQKPPPPALDAPFAVYRGVAAATSARQLADAVEVHRFPADLPERADRVLFHERIHYWQLIASPIFQLDFLHRLDQLRLGAHGLGLRADAICGQTVRMPTIDAELLQRLIESSESNWIHHEFMPSMVRGMDHVDHDPPAAMLFLLVPHRTPGQVLPAYGATLSLRDGGVLTFAFSGRSLVESAAMVSEHLFARQPLPLLESFTAPDDEVYLGPWELFRRLHGQRYHADRALALAFLAMVDLSLLPDVVDPDAEPDGEYLSEQGSISYRFGKLIFRAQGVPPLEDSDDPQTSIRAFQDAFCQYTGWVSPDRVLRKCAALLTDILLRSLVNRLPDSPDMISMFESVLGTRPSQWVGRFDELAPAWEAIARYRQQGAPPFGEGLVGLMLNATLYRLNNRGKFAIPHVYSPELLERFPLPVVLYGGNYMLDVKPDTAMNVGWPFPITALELVHDCISLQTLEPLRHGRTQCGFLEQHMQCAYLREGWGCPLAPLTEDQRMFRETTGLKDWCHWTLRALVLGSASEPTKRNWVLPR